MDVPRKGAARARLIRRLIYLGIVLAAIPLITWGLSRLKPAAPGVDRATVWIDTVKRGQMMRDVRGLGTLVPEDVLWIPATTEGRVEKILLRPGVNVKPDTIILIMSNPQVENDSLDAMYQLKQAEANLTELEVRLESTRLQQVSATAQVQSQHAVAKIQADRDEELRKLGLLADLQARLTRVQADELQNRYSVEEKRLQIMSQSNQALIDAQKVQVEKLRALYKLKQRQVEELKIRAGTTGVLQQLGAGTTPLEEGQRFPAGTPLVKIAQPWKLKAELKIAETQAKDIMLNQIAQIDTRNGIIPGKVSRIDPAASQGTVTVDVRLEGELPQGARPDLSVDGTVQLERLDDVLYVGRPVFGQANSTVTLFKLEPNGKDANRVQVKLGRSSVNTIEILEGLKVGDQVILSDMSAYDAHNRIQLN